MFTDVLIENDSFINQIHDVYIMQQFNSPNFTFFVVLLCFPNISKLLFGSRFLFDKFEAYLKHDACMVLAKSNSSPGHAGGI